MLQRKSIGASLGPIEQIRTSCGLIGHGIALVALGFVLLMDELTGTARYLTLLIIGRLLVTGALRAQLPRLISLGHLASARSSADRSPMQRTLTKYQTPDIRPISEDSIGPR